MTDVKHTDGAAPGKVVPFAGARHRDAAAARTGTVALVGAGPGDPDLLTLRGARLLAEADIVFHDRLVSPAILALAGPEARRVSVGKAPGGPRADQADIHRLLVDAARAGLRVVRLKGGDPFIFGRGGEEADELRDAGIAVEIVPGITAATGCAAEAGIPLTHRDHVSAVTFLTGQDRDGPADQDWAALAGARHTLVVYMGIASAAGIAGRLIAHGRSAETPVAVIQDGTRPERQVHRGVLRDLAGMARRVPKGTPGLIVIGAVAAMGQDSLTDLAVAATAQGAGA